VCCNTGGKNLTVFNSILNSIKKFFLHTFVASYINIHLYIYRYIDRYRYKNKLVFTLTNVSTFTKIKRFLLIHCQLGVKWGFYRTVHDSVVLHVQRWDSSIALWQHTIMLEIYKALNEHLLCNSTPRPHCYQYVHFSGVQGSCCITRTLYSKCTVSLTHTHTHAHTNTLSVHY